MDVRFKKALKLLEGIPKGRLLDVGCVQDSFKDVVPNGWITYGVDLQGGDNIIQCDINEGLPFQDNFFSAIFCGEIIEHSYDDSKFLWECNRVLKPDGKLILTTPNLLSLKNRFIMLFGGEPRFAYQRYHYHVYTLKELKKIVEESFRIDKLISNYILYSTNREPRLGKYFEELAEKHPSLGEHFIILATPKKRVKKELEKANRFNPRIINNIECYRPTLPIP